jgi:hypothetical protein
MPRTEDDQEVKRLNAAHQSLISTLQTKQLGRNFRLSKHFKVEETATDGWQVNLARLPLSKAYLNLFLDKALGGPHRHFWVGFWTRGKASMNSIVLNTPERFAPRLNYTSTDWKPVGSSFQLKNVKKATGLVPIYEYYAEEACYFGLYDASERVAINRKRFSDFICAVVRAIDVGSFDTQTKEFEEKVRKSLRDAPDARMRRLSKAPRRPKQVVRKVLDFSRRASWLSKA